MSLILEVPPLAEPVSLDKMKVILNITSVAEDVLISSMITAARVQIETRLNIAVMTQTWSWYLDDFPKEFVQLPITPFKSFASFEALTDAGTYESIEDGLVQAIITDRRASFRFKDHFEHDSEVEYSVLRVKFTAGFDEVPSLLVEAITSLVSFWYENRGPIAIGTLQPFSESVQKTLIKFKSTCNV